MNTLEGFEDENPFEQEGDHITSETSSTSQVALYEPPSPSHPSRQLSPSSPSTNRPPFPSQGSHRQSNTNYKTDFCCTRDRVLHSGEDVEILVRHDTQPFNQTFCSFSIYSDCWRTKDIFEFEFNVYHVRHSHRSRWFGQYVVTAIANRSLEYRSTSQIFRIWKSEREFIQTLSNYYRSAYSI